MEDSGIGIKPADQAKIFDNFRQADETTSRVFGGTGLGLAISRQLAALMDASLSVNSAAGQGARFTLKVPVQVDDATPSVGELATTTPVKLFHFGLGNNLGLFETYRQHWGLQLQAVASWMTFAVSSPMLARTRAPRPLYWWTLALWSLRPSASSLIA